MGWWSRRWKGNWLQSLQEHICYRSTSRGTWSWKLNQHGGGVVIECWPNESSGAPPPAHIHTIYRILQKLWRILFKGGTKAPSWLLETRGGVQRRPRGHLIFRSSSHSTHGSLSDFLKVSAQTLLLPSLSSDRPLASANQTSLWRNVLPTHKLLPDFYKFLFFNSLALLNWQKCIYRAQMSWDAFVLWDNKI